MVTRLGGSRRGTRSIMTKHAREKGKISITRYFQELSVGDKAVLKAEPSVINGTYHKRFHGKVVEVVGKKGRCYNVTFSDLGVKKTLIVHPVHLRKQQ